MNPSCPPDADPELAVTLKLNMGGVVAVVTNVGCKPAYRMVGCCGEGDPIPQVPSGSGGWIDAQCSSIGSCCEKPPHCVGLEPGQSVEVPVSALEQRRCCGRTYRVGLPYSRDPSCNEYDSLPGLIAYSNSVTLATPDPCEGKTPCGPKLSCDAATEVCVRHESWTTSYKCAPLTQGCETDRSCGCLGKTVCDKLFICHATSAPNTLSCFCPNC